MIRTKRKKFVKENGKKNYDFDFQKELNIYCFVCGEKLSRKQWKSIKKEERYNTYSEWKNYIRSKYVDLSLDKLKEFSKYLNHLERNMKPISEFANPYISAILSTVFSYIFTSLLNDEKQKKWILEIVIYLVGLILTIFFVFLCAKMLLKLLFDNSMEENLCKDYKEIVDELIEEKENKHKEHCKWEILPSRNILE